jgi:glycerophosphoryl diester phosphodiesterase
MLNYAGIHRQDKPAGCAKVTQLKLPPVIGHRGAAAYAPENTLDSIRTAAEIGVRWVELDVMLTKDGVPILFHDDTLERTTSGYGNVADTDYEDIRELEAGLWFSEGFTGVVVPTLEEAMDVILSHDLGVNFEIKPTAGREVETAEVMLDILSRSWDDPARILISSFQHVSLETAADMAPDLPRGLLMEAEWPENWQELADYLQVSTLNIDGNAVNREQVEILIELQKPVLAYTINDPQRARLLRQWGVDGFFTDDPEAVHDGLFKTH